MQPERATPARADAAARHAFVAMLAHDLRGPLTVAMGQAELLAASSAAFDATTREAMAADILGSVERLSRLLEDAAMIVAAEAGELPLALEDVDLAALLGAAAPGLGAAGAAGLRIHADPGLAQRALAELVANARAAHPGEPVIRTASRDGAVAVEIADAGESIPPDERAGALDRLGRRPGQRSRVRRRAELGVSLARALADAMGGGLEVDDPPGGGDGCVFRLWLPAAGG